MSTSNSENLKGCIEDFKATLMQNARNTTTGISVVEPASRNASTQASVKENPSSVSESSARGGAVDNKLASGASPAVSSKSRHQNSKRLDAESELASKIMYGLEFYASVVASFESVATRVSLETPIEDIVDDVKQQMSRSLGLMPMILSRVLMIDEKEAEAILEKEPLIRFKLWRVSNSIQASYEKITGSLTESQAKSSSEYLMSMLEGIIDTNLEKKTVFDNDLGISSSRDREVAISTAFLKIIYPIREQLEKLKFWCLAELPEIGKVLQENEVSINQRITDSVYKYVEEKAEEMGVNEVSSLKGKTEYYLDLIEQVGKVFYFAFQSEVTNLEREGSFFFEQGKLDEFIKIYLRRNPVGISVGGMNDTAKGLLNTYVMTSISFSRQLMNAANMVEPKG